jgi:hypothetical protein
MQELIYPDHLLILPGQTDPQIGTLITLLRTSALLWLAVIALVAGQVIMRAAQRAAEKPTRTPLSRPSSA